MFKIAMSFLTFCSLLQVWIHFDSWLWTRIEWGSHCELLFLIKWWNSTGSIPFTILLSFPVPTWKFKKVFFSVMSGGYYLGNALFELHTFSTALGSATAIFSILDRVRVFSFMPGEFLCVYICVHAYTSHMVATVSSAYVDGRPYP